MPTVNVFIGGTGVAAATVMKSRAEFYGHPVGFIAAMDTDAQTQDPIAGPVLGQDLVLAPAGFEARLNQSAAAVLATSWQDVFNGAQPFSLPVLYTGAQVVDKYLDARGGLYTLRAAGWLAFADCLQQHPNFLARVMQAMQNSIAQANAPGAGGKAAVLHVIASIAGGTGSGLFIPFITALHNQLSVAGGGPPNYEVHLTLVTHSAFTNDWAQSEDQSVLESRGESGAYAAYREVELLCRGFEDPVEPELRPIGGYRSRPRITRVHWLGRRTGRDANSSARDTFFEASRVLALLNDDAFEQAVAGMVGNRAATLAPSFVSIEYPKLETAQREAALASADVLSAMLEVTGNTNVDVLALPPRPQGAQPGPLVHFIQSRRLHPLVLSSPAKASNEKIEQSEVTPPLAPPPNVGPTDLIDQLMLPNTISAVQRGDARQQGAYVLTTEGEWNAYVAGLVQALEAAETQDLAVAEQKLDYAVANDTGYVVEALATAIEQAKDPTPPQIGSIGTAQALLDEVKETFSRARTFFGRGVIHCVKVDPARPLRQSAVQRAEVERRKQALSEKIVPLQPTGILYSTFWSVLLMLFAAICMAGFVLRLLPQPLVLRVPPVLELPPYAPTTTHLVIGALIGLALFALHRRVCAQAVIPVSRVREQRENEMVDAWSWYVTCRQAEMVWGAGAGLAANMVGDAVAGPVRAEPMLGRYQRLLDNARGWVQELVEVARARGAHAPQYPPQMVTQLWAQIQVRPDRMRTVWPEVRLEVVVKSDGGPQDLLVVPPTARNSSLSVHPWVDRAAPIRMANNKLNQHLDNIGRSFLAAIEGAMQAGIVKRGILPNTLDEMLQDHPQYGAPFQLAAALDTLARDSQQRGGACDLAVRPGQPLGNALITLLVVPDANVAMRVQQAIAVARDAPNQYPHLHELLGALPRGQLTQSANVGQAIALVQFRFFAWPDVAGPQLEDASRSRNVHYAIGRHRGGNPAAHNDYNATNTEFYLLPELSAAGEIEGSLGMTEPLPRPIVQRLYGSRVGVPQQPVPSLLDLFYLAGVEGYLHTANAAVELPPGPQVLGAQESVLLLPAPVPTPDRDGLLAMGYPLLSYPLLGALPADPFGGARRRIMTLDAFIVAMGYRGGPLGPSNIPGLPLHATIPLVEWQMRYTHLDAARSALLSHWFRLTGDGRAARQTYQRMLARAREDAALMADNYRYHWLRVCQAVFTYNLGILTGGAAADGPTGEIRF